MHPTAELFTEKAWGAIVSAQQLAQQKRQQQMESEHLFAALLAQLGGGNVVNAERTLKQDALEAYLANYSSGHEAAIAYQVTNGKNAMPAFGGKLSEGDIADVAAYVEEMASKGWA